MSPDRYEVVLTLTGLAALLAAWIPAYAARRPLSLPIVLVGAGLLIGLAGLGLPAVDPIRYPEVAERLTELGVIIALMGAGLKIDRPFSWSTWSSCWRMVLIGMPLTIAVATVLGTTVAGLGLASALLLGAALAPTDPVLASDVQVGEPTTASGGTDPDSAHGPDAVEDDVRFTLTAEGGLNDALAFPFVYLAIRIAGSGVDAGVLLEWLAVDVVVRIALGAGVGLLIGRLIGLVAFRPPGPLTALAETPQGFVAVAATLLAYGAAELVHGYGFLAVFVAALALRASERHHEFHLELHGFVEQTENLLVVGLLLLFGAALGAGLLSGLTWGGAVVAVLMVAVVRPAVGLAALAGSGLDRPQRWAIAFFGIRGIGSLYYLVYAVSDDPQGFDAETLWAVVAMTLVVSITVHGITATPAMETVDHASRRRLRWRRRSASVPGP
jgi:NhaP-type Na+/H+ or K+/H+ antiporter